MILETITLENLEIKKDKLSYKCRTALLNDVFNGLFNSENKNDIFEFSKILKMFRQEYTKSKIKLNQIINLFIKKYPKCFCTTTPLIHKESKQISKISAQKLKLINRNV